MPPRRGDDSPLNDEHQFAAHTLPTPPDFGAHEGEPDHASDELGLGFEFDDQHRRFERRHRSALRSGFSRHCSALPPPSVQSQATPPPAPTPPPKATNGLLGSLARGRAEPQWRRPSLNMLKRPAAAKPRPELSQTVMRGNARLLEDVLADFGIKGEVKDIRPGPVVTLYELEPSRGTKSSRVIGLAEDIARSMSVASVRAAVVPGRNAIGLELPNARREAVLLREILEAEAFKENTATLPLGLGKSISGEPVVADLARMPHLLVAGTTGSGKSVGINAMVLSLLYRHAPDDCRMLMIDPKMLELSVYNGIPHLLTPVITDPHKAVAALNWVVREMEERYKRMAALSVRNIDVFNNRIRNAKKRGEILSRTVQTGFDTSGQARFETQKMDLELLPRIVVIVDEFADLMIVAGRAWITAAVRCAPPANRPTPAERDTCLPFAVRETALLRDLRVVLCLGAFAWDAALRLRAAAGAPAPRPRPRFGHDALFDDGAWLPLLGCFHPSQQNTFTGRLTAAMLDGVLERARRWAKLHRDPPDPQSRRIR